MSASEDPVRLRWNQRNLLLRIVAPEQENDALRESGDLADDGVGEGLPSAPPMSAGSACGDRENGVEHQHSLMGPGFEVAMGRDPAAQIGVQFLVDIPKGTGDRSDVGLHRETQAVCMAGGGVRILPQQHDLYPGGWREFQGAEKVVGLGQDLLAGRSRLIEESIQVAKIGLGRFLTDQPNPSGGNGGNHEPENRDS